MTSKTLCESGGTMKSGRSGRSILTGKEPMTFVRV